MKALKTPSYLVQNILLVLCGALMVFGFLFMKKTIVITEGPWGFLHDGTNKIPLVLGEFPLFHMSLFLSFLCSYLLFEFYGFKIAFYSGISLILSIAATYLLFDNMIKYTIDPDLNFDYAVYDNFNYNKITVLAYSLGILFLYTTTFIMAALIKRLTRTYFMFIRYPIASALGFTAFIAVIIYLQNFQYLAVQSMLYEAASPLAQFLLMIGVSLIPLYLLRLLLGIFRGRAPKEVEEVENKSSTLFKGRSAPVETEDDEKEEDILDESVKAANDG